MSVLNTKGLADSLKKFYAENLSQGVNDFLDASQGFPPLAIEAKGLKVAKEAPALAGLLSLAAAKNIPRLKRLLLNKFGVNPETLNVMRAESPYMEYAKGNPKLKYFSPNVLSSSWEEILGAVKGSMTPHKLLDKPSMTMNVLDSMYDVPNRRVLNRFLGQYGNYDIDEFTSMAQNPTKWSVSLQESITKKAIPKKYRNVLTKIKQWEKQNKDTMLPNNLREHIMSEILHKEGIQNLILGTRTGEPSQIIGIRE